MRARWELGLRSDLDSETLNIGDGVIRKIEEFQIMETNGS